MHNTVLKTYTKILISSSDSNNNKDDTFMFKTKPVHVPVSIGHLHREQCKPT